MALTTFKCYCLAPLHFKGLINRIFNTQLVRIYLGGSFDTQLYRKSSFVGRF